MGNLWLKIKVGTKIAIFVILLIATLLFVFNNSNQRVKIWLWNEYDTTLLKVLFFTVLTSVIFTVLIGTAFRTIRQIKEIRARWRSQRAGRRNPRHEEQGVDAPDPARRRRGQWDVHGVLHRLRRHPADRSIQARRTLTRAHNCLASAPTHFSRKGVLIWEW